MLDTPAHASRQGNLPIQLTSFVGRERELAEVERLLSAARLVTLIGAPGIGKTRLALQVAARMASACPDGLWLVELAGLADPELVIQSVASALGVREQPNQALIDTLTDRLRSRELLIVLDNCEHLVGSCANLADLLLQRCPGVRMLATSREPLRVAGETTWRVPGLSVPEPRHVPGETDPADQLIRYESARLFVERARAVQSSFTLTARDAVAVTSICQRLDGIPLAIELAASRVRGLTPSQIARHLDDCFRVLIGGSRTALPRQQTLRAAVDWSHDLLTEPARVLLRGLSVFAGGFVLEAAEVICGRPSTDSDVPSTVRGPPSDDVLGLLLILVDRSLVEVETEDGGESRYRLLEPIRQYALEQLRAVGEEVALRRRHLAWCLDLVERGASARFGADAAVWAPRLIAEQANVRAALAWSLADVTNGSTSAGLRLARAFHHFWYFHDHLTEGRQWLERVLVADQAHNGDVGEPVATLKTAGDLLQAEQAAIRLGALGAHPRVAALNSLSHLAFQQQDHVQATARLEETLALARSVQDTHGVAHALVTLGQLALARGEYDRSVALLEEGRSSFADLDNSFGLWRALNTLGEVCNLQGEYERAGRLHEESLALARSMGYFWSIAQGLRQLGLVAYRQGDLERAERLLGESIVWWTDARATRGLQWSHAELGHVALARGNRVAAAAHFADSLMLCRQAGDRHGIAVGLEGVAAVVAREDTSPATDVTSAPLQRAARLLDVAAALREAIGVPISPLERPTVEGAEAAARSRLGEPAFAAVRVEGRVMPIEVAVDDALDLARALRALASDPSPVVALPAPRGAGTVLTVREQEVAVLIARGQTNRQIAATLVIAERTASTHVTNILGKLGFATRAQVAGWVVEQGLVGSP